MKLIKKGSEVTSLPVRKRLERTRKDSKIDKSKLHLSKFCKIPYKDERRSLTEWVTGVMFLSVVTSESEYLTI